MSLSLIASPCLRTVQGVTEGVLLDRSYLSKLALRERGAVGLGHDVGFL